MILASLQKLLRKIIKAMGLYETDQELERAKKRALHILERMPRTEKQLRDKLKADDKYRDETIDAVIAYVREYHYIDDRQYALDYINHRKAAKSIHKLMYELKGKGIDDVILEECREEYRDEDTSSTIHALIRKKGIAPDTEDIKERAKLYRFLAGKGFSYEEIRKACSEYDES